VSITDVVSFAVATAALISAGAALAACARLASFAELLVAAYLLSWAWLVVIAFGLSAFDLVTQGWLLAATLASLGASSAAWLARGRPPFPRPPSLSAVRGVLADPILLTLTVIAALALSYSVILAIGVAPNDWDALTYHLPRAALWKQQHAIGLFAHPNDFRLNVNPPIGEIGQLFVLTVGGGDRLVDLLQLGALLATSTAVYATARRIGLDARAGVFGGLAFTLLPLPLLQASSALTDLVVASFLVAAACFLLSARTAELALGGMALGLAVGTKFTGPLAVPLIAAVALLGPARARWRRLAVAGIAGLAAGAFWYLVNLAETGRFDGNIGQSGPQTINWIGWRARQYLFAQLEYPGGHHVAAVECLVAGLVLIAVSAGLATQRSRWARWFLLGGLITVVLPRVAVGGASLLERSGAQVTPLARVPDTALSWYGPVALLLAPVGFVLVLRAYRARSMPAVAVLLAAAPIAALVTLLALSYDPWRGRFFAYAFALSAATWGIALSRRSVAIAAVGLTGTMAVVSLGQYLSKPSGIGFLDERPAIFNALRVEQQLMLRSDDGGASAIRFISKHAGDDAHVAVSLEENDYLSPYFGQRYRRHVTFVDPATKRVPGDAAWVVAASSLDLDQCVWADTPLVSGWHVYRRTSIACAQP
jgi:hypothetical protein